MRGLLKSTITVAAVGVAAWLLRNRVLAPAPLDEHPPPKFRTTPPPTDGASPVEDDLTDIVGIGPVYRDRLHDSGIHTFAQLADADAEELADHLGTSAGQISDWTAQARERTS